MTMPVYAMSLFKLAKKSYQKLTSATSYFFWIPWSKKKKENPLAQLDKAMFGKAIRRLAFNDIHNFNQALLVKQPWRLSDKPNSPVAKVVKSKYYDQSTFLKAKK